MGYFYKGKHHRPHWFKIFILSTPSKIKYGIKSINNFLDNINLWLVNLIDKWDEFYEALTWDRIKNIFKIKHNME